MMKLKGVKLEMTPLKSKARDDAIDRSKARDDAIERSKAR